MKSIKLIGVCLLSIPLFAVFQIGSQTRAGAQGVPPTGISSTAIARFHQDDQDIRECLRDLFKVVHLSYSLDPLVQGNVKIDLRNTTFGEALEAVLKQVNAQYDVVGDAVQPIYQITRRLKFGSDSMWNEIVSPMPGTVAATSDRDYLFVVENGWVYKISKANMRVVSELRLDHHGR